MVRKHLPVNTGEPVYNLLAGVIRLSVIDARANDKRGREAQSFLDAFVPGWHDLQRRETIRVEDVMIMSDD